MTFREILDRCRNLNAVVVGDLMIDEYIVGEASRISPEAPVMVLRHTATTYKPGGAANVALNLQALGANVKLFGAVGADDSILRNVLKAADIEFSLVMDSSRVTTRKTRVLAGKAHQVLRIDYENVAPIPAALAAELERKVEEALTDCHVLVFSDYRKGALDQRLVESLVAKAKSSGATVVANPKPESAAWFKGADLISLNRAEASAILGAGIDADNLPALGKALREELGAPVLVTMGEQGMTAFGEGEPILVDAHKVEVSDVAGAGDTVVATVGLGLAAVGYRREVFELAAATAACVVQHVGVATPSAADLVRLG